MSSHDFVLSALSTSVTMSTQAVMDAGEVSTILDSSAVAVFNINLDSVKDVFKFSDSFYVFIVY